MSVTKIQALYRGYAVRRFWNNKKTALFKLRIQNYAWLKGLALKKSTEKWLDRYIEYHYTHKCFNMKRRDLTINDFYNDNVCIGFYDKNGHKQFGCGPKRFTLKNFNKHNWIARKVCIIYPPNSEWFKEQYNPQQKKPFTKKLRLEE